jgi:hypothetical protein
MSNSWSADVPISMPQPSTHQNVVPMFGFAYNQYGISHDINTVDYMNFRRPAMAPDATPGSAVHDDADVDNDREFL